MAEKSLSRGAESIAVPLKIAKTLITQT